MWKVIIQTSKESKSDSHQRQRGTLRNGKRVNPPSHSDPKVVLTRQQTCKMSEANTETELKGEIDKLTIKFGDFNT